MISKPQQIANLDPNELATLTQLVSSLGEKNVEVTVIETTKTQPSHNFYQQPQYDHQNPGGRSNQQIDVIEVYPLQSSNKDLDERLGRRHLPPARSPSHRPHSRGPPPWGPPPDDYDWDLPPPPPPRGHRRNRPPPHRRRPPPPDYDDQSLDDPEPPRPKNPHRGRRPPPKPQFEDDDPRTETTLPNKFDRLIQYPQGIIFPDYRRNNQENINLSDGKKNRDYDNEDDEEHNVAGYIDNFPVIFLKKNEIRRK